MQPHNEFRIHPRVVQIGCYWGVGGHTELYLLQGDTLALVDTGVSDSPGTYVAPALEALGLQLSDVELILNTHGHHDHAGGNGAVQDASGAPVWVHDADARVVEDVQHQFETYFAPGDTLVGRPDRLDASFAELRRNAGRPIKVDRRLADGEVISLGKGLELRVVHTPGHTNGSVCFYWEAEGLAITGDSVLGQGVRLGGLPLIYYPADYLRSLDLLLGMEIGTLAAAHHYRTPTVPRDSVHWGPDVPAYLRASREVADLIEDAVRRAAAERGGEGFLPVARAATALLAERLTIDRGEDGLATAWGTVAIDGYWRLLKA